jgi:integrase
MQARRPSVGTFGAYLSAAQRRIKQSWVPSTVDKRSKLTTELEAFLLQYSVAVGSRTVSDCTPWDLVVFLEAWWPKHAGSIVTGGSGMIASPSAVQGAASHLSTFFSSLGRSGEYQVGTGLGNPASSFPVRQWVAGYAKVAHHSGYEVVSAVPFTPDKVGSLLRCLSAKAAAEPQAEKRWLLERDGALISYCWTSSQRGGDGGRLRVGDVRLSLQVKQPLVLPFPPGFLVSGVSVFVVPFQTKTSKASRADPITFTVSELGSPQCFVSWLDRFSRSGVLLGVGFADPMAYLFSSSRCADVAVTSRLLNSRLQSHLEALGMWGGETSHSFRRGSLQAAATQGADLGVVASLGQIKSVKTLGLYLNRGSHLKRLRAVPLMSPESVVSEVRVKQLRGYGVSSGSGFEEVSVGHSPAAVGVVSLYRPPPPLVKPEQVGFKGLASMLALMVASRARGQQGNHGLYRPPPPPVALL